MKKNLARLRRAKTTRCHIRDLGVARLSVLRSGQHIYAQVFTSDGSKVLAAASTLQADVKEPRSLKKRAPPVLSVLHSTVPVTATMAVSRLWLKRPVKAV
jgi:large subunit ribosomal protein L18